MRNFIENIKEKCISFEYYGKNDIATGIEVKEIIDNPDFFKTLVKNCKLETIKTMEDYCKYFICIKYTKFQELIPILATDEFKKLVEEFTNEAYISVENIKIGEVIKFINSNIEEIFEAKLEIIGIKEVTLSFIESYKNGISEECYKWLGEHYNYLLLNHFESFEIIFEKYSYIFDQIFKSGHYDEIRSLREEIVFDIFARIYRKEKSSLRRTVERVITVLTEDILQLCSTATKDNVFFIERTVRRYVACLNNIKSPHVNKFVEPLKSIESLLDESVKENGHQIKFEIPTGKIVELWKESKVWQIKFISLSHDWIVQREGEMVINSRLEIDADGKKRLFDKICSNWNCDDYYTRSLQDELSILGSIETGTMLTIMQDKEMYCELMGMIKNVVMFISEKLDCASENFEKDIKILDMHLQNCMGDSDYGEDRQIALCYGASMFICALVDKLMRVLYVNVVGVEKYISVDKATLGQTLNPRDEFMKKYFGEKHIRHLAYFFNKDGEKERSIGYNYRNSLAHWTINPDSVSIGLVGQLMWLFIDIVNTIFVKFLFEKDN